eukprot:147271-Amphidinium_carterae.1
MLLRQEYDAHPPLTQEVHCDAHHEVCDELPDLSHHHAGPVSGIAWKRHGPYCTIKTLVETLQVGKI